MDKRKKTPKTWSKEVRDDVAKRHAAGESARAISKATGVPASTVVRWTKPSQPEPAKPAEAPASVGTPSWMTDRLVMSVVASEPAAVPAPAPAPAAAPPPPPPVPDLPSAPPAWEFQAAPVAHGEPPKPAEATAPPAGTVPPVVEMPAAVPGLPDMTAQQTVEMSRTAVKGMVRLVAGRLAKAGAEPLDAEERLALEDAWTPVAHKYLAGTITPEMNALVITVVVLGPRVMTLRDRKKSEREATPTDAVAAQTAAQAAGTAEAHGVDTSALMARLGAPTA